MSAILESEKGDPLFLVSGFYASPDGERQKSETARHFRIGERVQYVSFRRHHNLHDHPSGWMVLFDAADGKRYAATQTYFVTEECWQNLNKFFARSRRRKTATKRRKVSS